MSVFYDGFSYLAPFYKGNFMENETVMFIGEEGEAKLIYVPDEIVSVRNYGLYIYFEEGVDYIVEGRTIKRLKGSRMPFITLDEYFPREAPSIPIGINRDNVPYELEGERYLAYSESDTFTRYEIAVSYTHSDKWDGYIPRSKEERLLDFFNKLENGETVTLGIYGDSITTGCNSSGSFQGGMTAPFLESFPLMVKNYLENEFQVRMNYFNSAVGGWQVKDALAHLEDRVYPFNVDLLIVHLGLNNGDLTIDEYYSQMKELLEKIHTNNPETKILLLSSISCNPYSAWDTIQKEFYKAEQRLEDEYDYITHAEFTPYYLDILKKGKKFADFSGNNINHPSDFICRAYAQIILKTIMGEDYYK